MKLEQFGRVEYASSQHRECTFRAREDTEILAQDWANAEAQELTDKMAIDVKARRIFGELLLAGGRSFLMALKYWALLVLL